MGRLDEDSEGLILVTNDGDFSNRVAHPRYGVEKTYSVQVRGKLEREQIEKIRKGTWLAGGRTGGAKVVVRGKSQQSTSLLVTLREGKNREIRRVFAQIEAPVKQLKRVRIGILTIHKLKPGAFRPLTRDEVIALQLPPGSENQDQERGKKWGQGKGSGRKAGPGRSRRRN